jgi:SAM-dependent methyltransferase
VRENWSPRLVSVDVSRLSFFEHDPRFRGVRPTLASAFHVRDIDYRWERGVRHPLTPEPWKFQGVLQIARFNRPRYAAGLVAIVAALFLLAKLATPAWLTVLGMTGVAASAWWLVASLVASHLIYDRSPLRRWRWVAAALGNTAPHTWANLHAGLDESSPALREIFPAATGRVLDFFDESEMAEPSILRARRLARNPIRPERVDFRRLPLADGSTDLATLLLSAHELRTRDARVALFAELRRSLAPGGRIVVAEHLRDAWNLVAFGPGFTHFFARHEWLATFAAAGLVVERESHITPFVAVFVLRRSDS